MFFSSLELIGFKSFKREKFIFDKPISLFTGPNGCGKTNIVDAIRWVMGEQNPYNLRAKSMLDLIFHGNEREKPMSMAEVSIVLNNSNNILPIEFDEVKITRRIFPQGESIYMINERPTRLKDITQLLLDTGLSEDGYFLLTSEKIDAILRSNEERMRLFEEASAITGYRVRKIEAIGNLRKTQENITRIEDIIGELERQGNSLKYQASKARRYKRLKDELNVYKYHSLITEYNRKREELEKAQKILKEIEGEILNLEKINNERRRDFEASLSELKEMDNKLFEIRKDKEKIVEKIARDEERLIAIKEAREKIKEKEAFLFKKEKGFKDELLSIETEKNGLSVGLKEKRDIPEQGLLKIKSIIKEMIQEEEMIKDELIDRLSRKAGINGRLNQAQREISNLTLRLQRLNEDKEREERERLRIALRRKEREKERDAISERIEKQKKILTKLNEREREVLEEEIKIRKDNEFSKAKEGLVGKRLYGVLASENKVASLISLVEKLNLARSIFLKINELEGNKKMYLLIFKEIEDSLKLSPYGWKIVTIDGEGIGKKMEEIETPERLSEIEKEKTSIIKEKRNLQDVLLKDESRFKGLLQEILKEEEAENAISLKIARIEDEIAFCKTREMELKKEIGDFEKEQVKEVSELEIVEKRLSSIRAEIKNLKDSEKRMEDERAEVITKEQLQRERLRFLKEKEREIRLKIEEIFYEKGIILNEGKEKEKEIITIQARKQEDKNTFNNILEEEISLTKEKEAISLSIMEGEKDILKREERVNMLRKLCEENREKIKEIEISLSILYEKIGSIEAEYGEKIKEMKTGLTQERAERIEKELLKDREVSLSAISEYDKIKERIAFYKSELSDLSKAKDDLFYAINELDKKANEIFNETFEKIRKNFSLIFLKVLGGGSADIVMNNGRIEIEAELPGKKKKGLLLLSSGEKTLLAILLLFSLFIVKPVPFCFLDEVDAALDDANVKRFIELIKWLSNNTQFFIISHNKKTLEIGDTIYGITMETPGVSKSLSMRLKK